MRSWLHRYLPGSWPLYVGIGGGVTALLGATITENQLLLVTATTCFGIVTLVLKALLASPERESDAYKRGRADEAARCEEDIAEMKAKHDADIARLTARQAEADAKVARIHDALLRFVMVGDLTPSQRADIASLLDL